MIDERVLKEVSEGARKLHYEEVSLEELKKEISPEAYQLIRKAYEEQIEPCYLYWDEVEELYKTGVFSYTWEPTDTRPEYIRYWYLKPDGTLDFLEVSSELVISPSGGFESKWTPESLLNAQEEFERALKKAHPISQKALKRELENFLEERRAALEFFNKEVS